jgi:hypothetical protein
VGVGLKSVRELPLPAASHSRELLERIAASDPFQKSKRLRDLLLFLGERSLQEPNCTLHEQEIGVEVFGRPPDYDTSHDTLVRVHVSQLRKKLHDYFLAEGRKEPLVIEIPKGSYVTVFRPRTEIVETEPGAPPARAPKLWPFAAGLAVGLALASLASIALVIGLRWRANNTFPDRASRELAESPIWAGFRSSNVVVAVGTPLFFRSTDGLERNFSANFPEDLTLADQFLAHRPAYPQWNEWAPFEDVTASVNLDRFLRGLNSTVAVASARQISFGGLAGKRTIIVGQPRFAPLLVDLLAGQNFRPPPYSPGQRLAGFVNAQPAPGESVRFSSSASTLMMQSDESDPDFALVTRIRLSNAGEVLSVFGDRSQTGAYVVGRLTDPAFVAELDSRIFDRAKSAYQSAQIVFRVDYSRGAPTGLVYVTHRVKSAGRK